MVYILGSNSTSFILSITSGSSNTYLVAYCIPLTKKALDKDSLISFLIKGSEIRVGNLKELFFLFRVTDTDLFFDLAFY